MHTSPEPRWERWMIGVGEAMTMVWPATVFHHRPASDRRWDDVADIADDPGQPGRIGRIGRIGRVGRP